MTRFDVVETSQDLCLKRGESSISVRFKLIREGRISFFSRIAEFSRMGNLQAQQLAVLSYSRACTFTETTSGIMTSSGIDLKKRVEKMHTFARICASLSVNEATLQLVDQPSATRQKPHALAHSDILTRVGLDIAFSENFRRRAGQRSARQAPTCRCSCLCSCCSASQRGKLALRVKEEHKTR